MANPLARNAAVAFASILLAACGSNQPTGFNTGGDGGSGSDSTTGGDGSHGGKDGGGIHLTGDGGGADAPPPCTGLACDVKSCGGNPSATSVSGVVYAPNGTLPLYDVQVFIPNATLEPLPMGIQCDQCGAPVSGSPITTGLSDPTGHFTLTGVPAGTNIPIVVQLGKWRRQTSIPMVNACAGNTLTDPDITRLPANQTEGNMPHIALTTGGCDQMGCMLPKIGIATTEFGYQSDGYSAAVNTYIGETGEAITGATPASTLWGDSTLLATYDMAIFSCECEEPPEAPAGSPYYTSVTNYLNAGGRIFTTDFMYTWYKFSPDTSLGGGSETDPTIGIGSIQGGAPPGGNPISVVTTFPKGAALAQWLKTVFPTDSYAAMGEVLPDYVFSNVQSLNSETVTWAGSGSTDMFSDPPGSPAPGTGPAFPRVFTVDTPAGLPTAKQCGRGVHIDAHVDDDGTEEVGQGYPTTGCSTTLKPDEAMFAFFFFDLASCIQNEGKAPEPPPAMPQ
jgi:hypothetical protein